MVTDVALEICGDEHQAGAHIKLATTLAALGTELPLIEEISAYLSLFQESDQTIAEDFENTTLALQSLNKNQIGEAAQYASLIHSWQARCTCYLLRATLVLLTAAGATLKHDKPEHGYINEKLNAAVHDLAAAIDEGEKHSPGNLTLDLSEFRQN